MVLVAAFSAREHGQQQYQAVVPMGGEVQESARRLKVRLSQAIKQTPSHADLNQHMFICRLLLSHGWLMSAMKPIAQDC